MHVDRFRYLVRQGLWTIKEVDELIKGAPDLLLKIECLEARIKQMGDDHIAAHRISCDTIRHLEKLLANGGESRDLIAGEIQIESNQ